LKVVVDTNVLISGIFFSGAPSEILRAWRSGKLQICITPEIIDEYMKVTGTLAEQFPHIETNQILTLIIAHSEVIQAPPLSHQVCQDPYDDKFLACALAAESKLIISGDKHLLKLSEYQGVTILSPRAFVEQYLKNKVE
jgi:putative PIN family toxin of toxin-antitoxin system